MGLKITLEILGHVGKQVAGRLINPLGKNVEDLEFHCQHPDCGRDISKEGGIVILGTGKVYCLQPRDCSTRGKREAMENQCDPRAKEYRKKNGLNYAFHTGALTFYE